MSEEMFYLVPPIVVELVAKHDIPVTIEYDKELMCVMLDVNTEAKSQLRLRVYVNGEITGFGRYGELYENLDTVKDITEAVHKCMQGRDFVNPKWIPLLEKYGHIRTSMRIEHVR